MGIATEEKRDADHTVVLIEDGVPAFRLVNTSRDGRYRITKSVLSDPDREVVLQEIHFEALVGKASDYQVHVLVSPHLVNAGAGNTEKASTIECVRDHRIPPSVFRVIIDAVGAPFVNSSTT